MLRTNFSVKMWEKTHAVYAAPAAQAVLYYGRRAAAMQSAYQMADLEMRSFIFWSYVCCGGDGWLPSSRPQSPSRFLESALLLWVPPKPFGIQSSFDAHSKTKQILKSSPAVLASPLCSKHKPNIRSQISLEGKECPAVFLALQL